MKKLSLSTCLIVLAVALPVAQGQTFDSHDVGEPAIEGSTTIDGSQITVVGAGNDIWNNSDQFQFHYTTVDGDFDAVVRVESLEGTHSWAKAELMCRYDEGEEEPFGSNPHISMMATRTGGQNLISPQWRKEPGGGSGWNSGNVVRPVPYPNVWFRLVKSGSVISGYFSEDGSEWTKMYEADTSDPDFDVIGQGGTWGNGVDFGDGSKLHVGLAVTSHDVNSEATAVFQDFQLLEPTAPTAPTIATQPADQTVVAGASASFSVAIALDASPPPTFQWTKNGQNIADATGATLYIDRAAAADNGAKIAVKVTNSAGTTTSDEATLTVTADDVPPTLVSASGSAAFTTVRVVFSEPLDQTSAETAANYTLSGGVTVSGAALAAEAGTDGDHIVVLTTSRQAEGTDLTLTVSNVEDANGVSIAANSTIDFRTYVWQPGVVLHKRWNNINTRVPGIGPHGDPDETFRELETLAAFPDNPDVESLNLLWEGPVNVAHEYASQIVGWFIPAETDDYIFITASDDPSNLYLSPDDDPANKFLIAQQISWSGIRDWNGGEAIKRSDEFHFAYEGEEEDLYPEDGYTGDGAITLQAGQRYYMESVHREGTGGDNLAVTFYTVDEDIPTNGTPPVLTGDLIGTYLNPNGAEATITQHPQDTSVLEGREVTFTVRAEGTSAYGNTIAYQWQSADAGSDNFTDIAGAISASYTTPAVLAANDNGRRYRVVIGAPALQVLAVPSNPATLTVTEDTIPPKIVAVIPLGDQAAVQFDERLKESSATRAGNYKVSGVSVSSAETFGNEGKIVVLALSDTPAAGFTVSAVGVEDFVGNAITSTDATKVGGDILAYWDFDDAQYEGYTLDKARSAVGELREDAVLTADGEGRTGNAGDRAADFGTHNNRQNVNVADAEWLNFASVNNSVTIAFWQKWTVPTGNQSSFWAVSPSSSGGSRGIAAHTPWGSGLGTIVFDTAGCCNNPSSTRIDRGVEGVFPEHNWQEWTHLAFIKDADWKYIYINGEFFHEGENTSPLPNDFTRLVIGSNQNGSESHGGLVDDFAVFANALSEEDIQKLAEGMRPDEIREIMPIVPDEPFVPPSPGGEIMIVWNAEGAIVIEYTGTLHSSDTVDGTFTPVDGASSPYVVTPDATQKFYSAR